MLFRSRRPALRHRLAPLPLGDNVQLLPHRERLIILLPVVGPVLLPQRAGADGQAAAVRLGARPEGGQARLQLLQPGPAVLVVGQIAMPRSTTSP